VLELWIRQARENEARRQAALQLCPAIGALLAARGARRAWLFGSLAWGRGYEPSSDIDIAVEGIPPDRILRVGCDLEARCRDFEVDLVDLREVSPGLRERILREGVLLYDSSP
jgi:predicted nucleotidyltransferase